MEENRLNNTNYQIHFPKISMYFGHNVSTDTIDRMEQTPANVANFLKKDQTQETVPYTIIQT